MTILKPCLFIERLIIKQNKNIVYDEFFHKGVNFIIGSNGSGKTTIIESIIHVLGGDVINKKHEFSNCTNVFVQLNINGNTYVFKRDITNDNSKPPLEIFEGSYDLAQQSFASQWQKYPLRRSNNQKSFSEMIFTLLGFPEVKLENSQNITINSILRLLYEDQQATTNKIFKDADYPVERGDTRQAISDVLLNIDDFDLLDLKTQLNNKNNEYTELNGQLKQIHEILGSVDIDTSLSFLKQQKESLEKEKEFLIQKINSYPQITTDDVQQSEESFNEIQRELCNVKNEIHQTEINKKSIEFDLEDSKEFLESLNVKIDAMSASTEISKYFGAVDFSFCPSCLHPLENVDVDSKKCPLCKENIDSNSLAPGFLKMMNEINFQKKETERIIASREAKLISLRKKLSELQTTLENLKDKYKIYIIQISPIDAQKRLDLERIGYLSSQIDSFAQKESYANKVATISDKREKLGIEISKLEEKIKTLESNKQSRKDAVYKAINDNTLNLIHNDPSNELNNVEHIAFDFKRDELSTPNKTSPAASTSCYLKNAFFFSIFLTSLDKKLEVRYPRFIILDNVEDKGLETNRIQQFHKDVILASQNSDIEHQIIITARSEVVSDEIRNSDMVVGEEYSSMQGTYSLSIKNI